LIKFGGTRKFHGPNSYGTSTPTPIIFFFKAKMHECRALQWVPMNFFPKIPEIDLRRFSLQFSLGVIVAIHENLEKFQNISIEDLSENLQYLEKRFQCDNAVYRNQCRNNEAFSRHASYH
jgi:hypothetical protein